MPDNKLAPPMWDCQPLTGNPGSATDIAAFSKSELLCKSVNN